jgi:hypothetical protein
VITGHQDQPRIASLLDLDPDLGRHLSPDGVAPARREIAVRVVARHAGPWHLEKVHAISGCSW